MDLITSLIPVLDISSFYFNFPFVEKRVPSFYRLHLWGRPVDVTTTLMKLLQYFNQIVLDRTLSVRMKLYTFGFPQSDANEMDFHSFTHMKSLFNTKLFLRRP